MIELRYIDGILAAVLGLVTLGAIAGYVSLSGQLRTLEASLDRLTARSESPGGARFADGRLPATVNLRLSTRLGTARDQRPNAPVTHTAPTPPATADEPSPQAGKAPERGLMARLRTAFGGREPPTDAQIEQALADALRAGLQVAVARLGQPGGFAEDPAVRIPLPAKVEAVKDVLANVGMGSLMDDVNERMNQAAELTIPRAAPLFEQAMADLPLRDMTDAYEGSDTAATAHFKRLLAERLIAAVRPLAAESLEATGARTAYDQAIGVYSALPFVPEVDGNLVHFVASRSVDAVIYYMGVEEAGIRSDPDKRTTVAMRTVFGDGR